MSALGARPVLVVENNTDTREALRILLTALGHHVEVAADGEEGVRKALEFRPRAVLVEIILLGIDGFEVARRIRAALGSEVVLVAFTVYSREDVEPDTAEACFDHHLVKPVSMAQLESLLKVE